MKKAALLVLPVVLVLLTSGCTTISDLPVIGPMLGGLFGPTTVKYTNDVVIIRSLDATPSTIYPGQTVRLTAYVQNQGKNTLSDVTVDLYDYCLGTFALKSKRCGTGSTDVSGGTATDSRCSGIKLYPYETKEISWTLQASECTALETTCPSDGMKVLVNYKQKTDGISTISLIKYEEMQNQMSEGRFKEKQSFIAAGEGPVKGYINVEDKQPVAVSSDVKQTVISFQARNEGSGFLAFKPDYTPKSGEKPYVTISKINMDEVGTIQTSTSGDSECSKLTSGGKIELILKESPKIVCSVDLSSIAGKISKELSATMRFSMEYYYEFRSSSKVTVKPKAMYKLPDTCTGGGTAGTASTGYTAEELIQPGGVGAVS